MADDPVTLESQPVVLPPHLWENFETADAELREFYGVSPGALALMRLWLACGSPWRVRAEFERSILDIKHRALHPNKEGDFDEDCL